MYKYMLPLSLGLVLRLYVCRLAGSSVIALLLNLQLAAAQGWLACFLHPPSLLVVVFASCHFSDSWFCSPVEHTLLECCSCIELCASRIPLLLQAGSLS